MIHTKMVRTLGAQIQGMGVSFGVWAPNADSVSVVGSFNNWDEKANPCTRDDQGNWFAEVSTAKAGDEYRYIISRQGQSFSRIDPRARLVTNSVGNSVIVNSDFDWGKDAFQLANWNKLVIYELHLGTFAGKPNSVGTFEDAIDRLPYLMSLGINAIELMPLAEFAGDYSWGYNPAHPFAVETAYGGPDGLKEFVKKAHENGIGIIADVVYNHFGPSDLSLWQFDGWSENGKGGIYFFNDWRSSTPWGDTRPDYGRGEVRQYIFDNAMMWLEEYRVDGLRYDMTLYMRSLDGDESNALPEGFSLAQWINREASLRYPNKITIAEDLRNNEWLTENHSNGGAHFGAQWAADFVHPVRKVLTEIDDRNRSMHAIRNAITVKYNNDAFRRVIYTESHDEVANGKQRVVSEIDPSESPNRYAIKRSTLGTALMLTSPGIPMLFQGQEFLRDKWFTDTRAIDWSRADRYLGVVAMHRDLINLRLNKNGSTEGLAGQNIDVFHVNDYDKVIAFRRWSIGGPGDETVVILCFSEGMKAGYRMGFPIAGEWKLRFNSDAQIYDAQLDGVLSVDVIATEHPYDNQPFSGVLSLGAYSCLVYSQNKSF
jgi:1,4-alpha-glucan branching enzyme